MNFLFNKLSEEKTREILLKDFKLLTKEQYQAKYKGQLTKCKLHDYLNYNLDLTHRPNVVEAGMIHVPDKEYVPGGAWPGNYMSYFIKDERISTATKRAQKCDKLQTTKQTIAAWIAREKKSIFNLPHRLYEEYSPRLLCFVGSTLCSGSKLPPNMLKAAIKKMTPEEYANYLIKVHNIHIELYPTIEKPILVRFDGIDDGAEEKLFADVKSAKAEVYGIAFYASRYARNNCYFRNTD